jgi:hypothetical protein
MAATPTILTKETLGHALEQQRLQHRARRIELATLALKGIADTRSTTDRAPAPLLRAINRFELELAEIQQRLTELRATHGEG